MQKRYRIQTCERQKLTTNSTQTFVKVDAVN
ncbi:hypothetical protein PCAR4_810096 [Paraburkholderia caribensis]|nr:hypothetical protein PCAR4_810096 [Paraburkholderia caribensis]